MEEARPSDDPGLWIRLTPPSAGRARVLHLSWRDLAHFGRFMAFLAVLSVSLVGTWWYYASGYQKTGNLPALVAQLQEDQARINLLSEQLEEAELLYAQIWTMLGADRADPGAFWLPPPTPTGVLEGEDLSGSEPDLSDPPSGWPLVERGFLSQPLAVDPDVPGGHTGIDLAIPSGSYILAVGPGRVAAIGEDPVYGLYVFVEHRDGWESRYAHASVLSVELGDLVQEGDVLGLTGSSGRSTAPHLHFELIRNGRPVDPLLYLTRP